MKQEIRTDTANAEKMVGATQTQNHGKNVYEPYSMPGLIWELIRVFACIVFLLIMCLRLRNRYNIPRRGPYIIAANHLSWIDVVLVPAPVPGKVTFMAKEEAFHGKLGWLVRFLGAFPVKRGEADRQAIRTAENMLKNKKVLVIFPEGTRVKASTLAKAHAGIGMIALRSGVPVLPVAVWGSEHAFRKFRPQVTVCYGEPVVFEPKGAKVTREDIEAAAEEVMRRIAAMLPEHYRGVYDGSNR